MHSVKFIVTFTYNLGILLFENNDLLLFIQVIDLDHSMSIYCDRTIADP